MVYTWQIVDNTIAFAYMERMLFPLGGIPMPDIATIKKGIYMVVSEYPIKKAELFGAYAEGTYRL